MSYRVGLPRPGLVTDVEHCCTPMEPIVIPYTCTGPRKVVGPTDGALIG